MTNNTVKTMENVMEKYNVGKLLSKNDCKIIIDEIYNTFVLDFQTIKTEYFDILIDNAEKVVKKQDRPFSDNEVKEYYGLSFCNNHTAKMAGMESISTNNKINKRCAKNKCIKGSICENCFADAQIDMFKSMNKPLTINYLLLNYRVLPVSILPIINRQFCRIESFGDVASGIQAINYCNIMTAHNINKNVQFAAWTKNPDLWFIAFDMIGKPENLSFGISSLFKDKVSKVPAKIAVYVDFIFTVFETVQNAKNAGYNINCGARHCLSCLRCYNAHKTKTETGETVLVIELKK